MDFLKRAEANGYLKIIVDPQSASNDVVCVHGFKCIPQSFALI